MLSNRLVGVLGSGLIGYDPFDRKCWSGSGYYVFSRLQSRGVLHRAFGVEVARPRKYLLMLRHFHADRMLWQRHYYMSASYREALTEEVGRRLAPDDYGHDVFQLGAMYDVPRLLDGRARCFSYHDGNLAQLLRAPNVPERLSTKRIDEGLEFERRVYGGIDRIFAMSEYLRRSFIEDCGIPAERVSNIGAGINLDTIPEPIAGKRYDTQEILFIGVDFARKGGPQLLEAFRRVRQKHPRATLHVVGPRSLEIPLGQSEGVRFHGYLSKNDPHDWARLQGLFESSSLFVMPSLYEPFGIAPLEAMVHEIPAMVSRGWLLEEMVTPGVTGAHVEPGSVDDLADRLDTLLDDPNALHRMGQVARAYVLQRHTWPQVIDRMIAEIQSVQNGR